MSLRFLSWVLAAGALVAGDADVIRFCAEPANMPLSNESRDGLENRVAELVGSDLRKRVEFVWWSARRGYVRNTLTAHRCDVLSGVPEDMEGVLTTRAYYSSTYVFVQRAGGRVVGGLDDPVLASYRIGLPMVGSDYAPPAYFLAARNVVRNIVPFSILEPQSAMISALNRGEIDIGVLWGPTAAYLTRRTGMTVTPVRAPAGAVGVPLTYGISMAVAKDRVELRNQLDAALERHRAEIQDLVRSYQIPQVEGRRE